MGSDNLEQAKLLAFEEAQSKYNLGLLISVNDPDYDSIFEDGKIEGKEGGPETLHSIVSMYADSENNDGSWDGEILEFLEKGFAGYS